MKFATTLAITVVVLALPFSGMAQTTLGAVLTGSQEAPGPGDPDGFGHSTVVFSEDRTQVTITTHVGGLSSVTDGHIHTGAVGVPGGVLIGFVSGAQPFVNGASVTLPVDPLVASQIISNPTGYYVNLHNAAFPAGAIRGQLTSDDNLTFGNSMDGDNEEPGPGDDDGRGAFLITIDDSRTQLSFDVVVANIGTSFTGAHIHTGGTGVQGPVLVGLMTPAIPFVGERLSGTMTIPAEIGAAIAANPAGHYVNVHTTEFTAGAVRGQLGPVHEVSLAAVGRVVGALGELFVTDTRVFNPSFDETITVLFEFFRSGAGAQTATTSKMFEIAPRGTMILDDVVGAGLLETDGLGAARLTSSHPIVAGSRIFDDGRSTNEGTIGQFFPGLSHEDELRRGVIPGIAVTGSLAEKGQFRTNVGFFNPHAHEVTVHIDLIDPSGGQIAPHDTITLAPMMHTQRALNQWFDLSGDVENATMTFNASAGIFGYASVIDGTTSDPIAIIAQEDPGEPGLSSGL